MIDVIIACSEKKNHFLFHSLNRNFFVTLDKLLHLGIKNEWIHFVLLSFFRNFAAKFIITRKNGKEKL